MADERYERLLSTWQTPHLYCIVSYSYPCPRLSRGGTHSRKLPTTALMSTAVALGQQVGQ